MKWGKGFVTDLTFKESDVPLAIFLRRVTCGLVHFQSALLYILPGEHCNNNTGVQSLHSRVSELVQRGLCGSPICICTNFIMKWKHFAILNYYPQTNKH